MQEMQPYEVQWCGQGMARHLLCCTRVLYVRTWKTKLGGREKSEAHTGPCMVLRWVNFASETMGRHGAKPSREVS